MHCCWLLVTCNAHSVTQAAFEHPLNDYKSVQVTRIVHDFYDSDPARGFYGGGGMDGRPFLDSTPIFHSMMRRDEHHRKIIL